MKNIKKIKHGFTLIELIVVITILAILGAISFVSFNSCSSSARDSARISDLTNISKALSVYQTSEGTLPTPEDNITISSGSTTLLYQGYMKTNNLSLLKISGKVIDPKEQEHYRYVTSGNKNIYQLIGYMENLNNVSSFNLNLNGINKAFTVDYMKSYISSKGCNLGTLVNNTTNEALTKTNYTASTNIDISNASTTYTDIKLVNYFSGTIDISTNTTTGTNEKEIDLSTLTQQDASKLIYNSIDTSRLRCGGGINLTKIDPNIITAGCTTTILLGGKHICSENSKLNSEWNNNGYHYYSRSKAMYGNTTYNTTSNSAGSNNNGACPTGYHIPTDIEWATVLGAVSNSYVTLRTALNLQIDGRHNTDGSFSYQGTDGFYWLANEDTATYSWYIGFNSSVGYKSSSYKLNGFSVRCFKD